jgi:ubiquinone/menaquinone biosynthesis C-methylase UbiE
MKMTNPRNQAMYRRWAPVYDATVSRLFGAGRRRAMQLLSLQPGERILLSGVGTGEDLALLPRDVCALGIDLSPHMLQRAHGKLPGSFAQISLVQGDAQRLPVANGSFDALVLNLILSVVPDARLCMQEALRALRPGGRIVIFDKFMSEKSPSTLRRLANFFSTRIGTDINRRFLDMLPESGFHILQDEPGIAGGMYRVIAIQKDLPGE